MSFKLSERSLEILNGCDRALRALFKEVAARLPYGPILGCVVVCGRRTLEEQTRLYHAGKSKTMKSKHLFTPSLAVDVAIISDQSDGKIDWDDGNKHGYYPYFGTLVKDVARAMDIPVEWGGDWKIRDYVHWQLPEKSSPARFFPAPENLETSTDIIGSIMADIENMENKLRKLQQIMEAEK